MTHSICNAILVADLTNGTVERIPAESLNISSAEVLCDAFPDSVILFAGILSGSYAPAACTATAKIAGKTFILKGQSGPGLRRCRVEAMVIKGRSQAPCGAVVNEKGVFFFPVDSNQTVPELKLRFYSECAKHAPLFEPAILLTGTAAFAHAGMPAISLNVGIAPGSGELAAELSSRGLTGLALAGSTPVASCVPLDAPIRQHAKAERVTKANLKKILQAASPDTRLGRLPSPGRSIACFACSSPCGFWINPAAGEPVACTSPKALALLSAAGADEKRIAEIFAFASTYGLDPAGLTDLASGNMPADLASWNKTASPSMVQAEGYGHDEIASRLGICEFYIARHSGITSELERFI
ncbi:MAG: hypothetical protein J6I40_07770 [Mailhella sp.]|nr:hypothetical protein [Mailhella sp.]